MTIVERDLGHIPIQELGGVFAFTTFEKVEDKIRTDEVFCLLDLESKWEMNKALAEERNVKQISISPMDPFGPKYEMQGWLKDIDTEKLLIIVSFVEGGIRLKACKTWTTLFDKVKGEEGLEIVIGKCTFHRPVIGKLKEIVPFDKEYDAYHKLYKEVFLPNLKNFQEFETRMCERAKMQKRVAREKANLEKNKGQKKAECIIL